MTVVFAPPMHAFCVQLPRVQVVCWHCRLTQGPAASAELPPEPGCGTMTVVPPDPVVTGEPVPPPELEPPPAPALPVEGSKRESGECVLQLGAKATTPANAT